MGLLSRLLYDKNMKKIFIIFILSSLFLPLAGHAAGAQTPKTFSGVITKILGTQLEFITTAGAYYTVQSQGPVLAKRYGATMQPNEFVIGDKIQVTGFTRPDNSINGTLIKDMSLFVHTSTFNGKILH